MRRSSGILAGLLVAVVLSWYGSAVAGSDCCATMKKDQSCQTQAPAKDKKAGKKEKKSKAQACVEQTMSSPEARIGDLVCCPVMGSKFKVAPDSLSVDVAGKKIYVCCPGCVEPLKANPEKYLKK